MTRRRRDYRIWYVLLAVFIMVFLFSFLSHRFNKSEKEVGAASLVNFDPGYIISDWQMGNYHSMSETDIQMFLKSKNTCYDTNISKYTAGEKVGFFSETSPPRTWHVTNGHFVCMADEIFDGGTAAHIIYRAAQDYRINPQVLIVLLEKEQSLITDSFPHSQQYRSATGYGCPDTAPCSSQYYGLQNQIRKAAELFRTVLDGGWTNYPLGDNYVQYNPNSACGGSVVNIRSLATSALYRYTPYQPNAAVLSGGSDGCGAYGNMNFYKLFEDWFGGITSGKDGRIEIKKYANDNQEKIGDAITDIICGLSNGGCYQVFDGGYVYWSLNSDAHLISGEIFNRWFKTGTEWGLLKYPMSDQEKTTNGGFRQKFQTGNIYWTEATGAWDVSGGIYQTYLNNGTEWGVLGYPTSSEMKDEKGVVYQTFEHGAIFWDPATGGWVVRDFARAKWQALGGFKSKLGHVVDEGHCGLIKQGCYQAYRTGNIYWTEATGAWDVSGGIYQTYLNNGTEWGVLGYPTSSEMKDEKGVVYQTFEHGAIFWDPATGGTVRIQ